MSLRCCSGIQALSRSATSISRKFATASEETVLQVDEKDTPIGVAKKEDAHAWPQRGKGEKSLLHRAFSVVLFDQSNRLLIQRRADKKSTFPGFWGNACCSHQLIGMVPSEIDSEHMVERGQIHGTLSAARRKLRQELGMEDAALDAVKVSFAGRMIYSARDPFDPSVGEHELDYLLVARLDGGGEGDLEPNYEEEIAEVRAVDKEGLRHLLTDPGARIAPWFRLIADEYLPNWWYRLDAIIAGQEMSSSAPSIRKFE